MANDNIYLKCIVKCTNYKWISLRKSSLHGPFYMDKNIETLRPESIEAWQNPHLAMFQAFPRQKEHFITMHKMG